MARAGSRIASTVQLQPAWEPNQPHRADVVKLLVGRDYQHGGLSAHPMEAIERAAHESGFRLLTLDAKRSTAAERLYRRLGWPEAGQIPRFALDPNGRTFHDAVIFYKELA